MKEAKFVEYEKLSKKAKALADRKKRGSWGGVNPITRKSPSPKAYDRLREKRNAVEMLTIREG